MTGDACRIGAYVLAADPTWLLSSIARYYDRLDVLVVVADDRNTGWTGAPIEADRCVAAVEQFDSRGVVRVLRGRWEDRADPMRAETAQRQAALDTLRDLDWVLQLDGDEVLPQLQPLLDAMAAADGLGLDAVEWPMRVLFRRRHDGSYLEVTGDDGRPHFEYPGPVAVRAGSTLTHARRTPGGVLRVVVADDTRSAQVAGAPAEGEVRRHGLCPADAIVHNSWARDPRSVRSKLASWGHHEGSRTSRYFVTRWWPAPVVWRALRNFHPLFPPLWPRLSPTQVDVAPLLLGADRVAS